MINTSTKFTPVNTSLSIWVYYDVLCEYAVSVIKEYYNSPEYTNTIFMLSPCYEYFNFYISSPITRQIIYDNIGRDPERIIFLNFDHLIKDHYVDALNKWLDEIGVDEIWEWQIENFIHNKYKQSNKVKFMPMRYSSTYAGMGVPAGYMRKYDFTFIGSFGGRRQDILGRFTYFPYQILSGYPIQCFKDELNNGGFLLNISGDEKEYTLREQLRISTCISMGIPVMTEKDMFPYYPGITDEFELHELDDVYSFTGRLRSEYYMYRNKDVSKLYKDLTQSDQTFEQYRNNILAAAKDM